MNDSTRHRSAVGALLALLIGCGSNDASMPNLLDATVDDATVDAAQATDATTSSPDAASDAATDAQQTSDAGDGGEGLVDAGDAGVTGPNVDRSDPQLHESDLDPIVLDPNAADSLAHQYAQLDTRAAPLGKLVIFLPGATNTPRDWRDHGRVLASFGFHVLIPHYNNRWSSDGTCDGMGNSCGNDTRWEALVGEDTSSAVTIARGDSAEGRVITMIKHLITAEPGGDWGYYLDANDELLYGRAIIAGISHGAASAGMYAARRPFTRNVMHSSGPAGSSSGEKMTPLTAWYAFAHTEDPAYSAITTSWNNFALPGALTSIDGEAPPYGESHRLITSAASSYPHGSTCAHGSSPTDSNNNYIFEPAWRYLYGAPSL